MVFASALKVFSTFSLRRFTADMNIANERGFIEKFRIIHLSYYMENHELTPIIKDLITITSLALTSVKNDFTIDSSGFGSLAL
jgi:hypothetical protein